MRKAIKISVSMPEKLKVQLDERAEADQVPVSQLVTEAVKAYLGLPSDQASSPPLQLAEQLRQMQAYLWDLHFSHECTRATALNLYYWAQRHGEDSKAGHLDAVGVDELQGELFDEASIDCAAFADRQAEVFRDGVDDLFLGSWLAHRKWFLMAPRMAWR